MTTTRYQVESSFAINLQLVKQLENVRRVAGLVTLTDQYLKTWIEMLFDGEVDD